MSNITKHYLENAKESETIFNGKAEDIFRFSDQIDKVEEFCSELSQKINSNVYWYKTDTTAFVCVCNEYADDAIDAGKEIIIKKFDNISTNYISKKLIPVLEDYSIIATVDTKNIEDFKLWCKNHVDGNNELLIKTKDGIQCILAFTRYVDDFRSKLKIACVEHRFNGAFDFTYNKFKIG